MTFNTLAPTYDADFTDSQIARWLRERVHERLSQHFAAGSQVLELGCGTGEDALWLARRGVRVLATDVSPAMLEAARVKTAREPLVTVAELDLQTPPPGPLPINGEGELLTGVFSNFGPLNCVGDWRPLAGWLAGRVRPGGIAAFGVMSPFCLWEIGWHGLHGDVKTAARRLRGQASFQPDADSPPLTIYYPTIRRLKRDFAPHFRCVHVGGLGLFLPPSDVYGMVERRPRLLALLTALEQRFAPLSALAGFADHYWIEFRHESGSP